jgi:hypothetical protein
MRAAAPAGTCQRLINSLAQLGAAGCGSPAWHPCRCR